MRQTMADVIDVVGLQHEVERRAGVVGLRCHFSKDIKSAFIDCKSEVLYCPAIPVPFSMDEFKVVRMSYVHELGHWHNRDLMKLRVEYPIKINSNLGIMWNILEDQHDERTTALAYPGDAKALGEGNSIVSLRQLAYIKDFIKTQPIGPDDIKRLAAMMMADETRHDWDLFIGPTLMMCKRTLPPEVISLYKELLSEGWVERIIRCRDAEAVRKLACQLHDRLWPPEDKKEDGGSEGESGEKQMADAKAKSEAKGKAKGEGDDKGEDEDGEGKGAEELGGEDKPTELAVIPWTRLTKSQHDALSTGRKTSRIDWSGKSGSSYPFTPATPAQIRMLDITK